MARRESFSEALAPPGEPHTNLAAVPLCSLAEHGPSPFNAVRQLVDPCSDLFIDAERAAPEIAEVVQCLHPS